MSAGPGVAGVQRAKIPAGRRRTTQAPIDGIGLAPISAVLSSRVAVQAKRYDPTATIGRDVVALFQRDAVASGRGIRRRSRFAAESGSRMLNNRQTSGQGSYFMTRHVVVATGDWIDPRVMVTSAATHPRAVMSMLPMIVSPPNSTE
jgi:hypothetical protein